MPRIEPLCPPYSRDAAAALDAMMPAGVEPIGLFRTFARNLPMAEAMRSWGGYELSRSLSLTLRDREIVIDRVCARCRCEYEWGVHVAFFGERAKLTEAQIASLTEGDASDDCWTVDRDRLLIEAVDQLHDKATIDDLVWARLTAEFTDSECLDLLLLAGWYHAISYAANAAGVDLEPGAPRFADVSRRPG